MGAAQAVADWWSEHLDEKYADRREFFKDAIVRYLDGREGQQETTLKVDYDPLGLMLAIVRETIDPECRGFLFSAKGMLPNKTQTWILDGQAMLQHGYGAPAVRIWPE